MEAYHEEAARRAEAIHRVDSAFGILLVIATLWMNLVVVYLAQAEGSMWTAAGVALYTLAVAFGLFGILRQSWDAKYLGWFFTFAFLLTYVFLIFNAAMGNVVPKYGLPRLIIAFAELFISLLLVDRIVIKAYLDRIRQVSWTSMHASEDEDLVRRARVYRRVIPLALIVLAVLFMLA